MDNDTTRFAQRGLLFKRFQTHMTTYLEAQEVYERAKHSYLRQTQRVDNLFHFPEWEIAFCRLKALFYEYHTARETFLTTPLPSKVMR